MSTDVQWSGADAKRARAKLIKAAARVKVYVVGRDDGYYVQTTKRDAYRLVATGQFTVSCDGDAGTVYVERGNW